MAFYSAANHLIDNLGLDHLNSININIPVYCTGASAAASSSSSSSSLANSKASTSTSTMQNHHPNQNQNQNVYSTSYYTTHPYVNTTKASTSTSGTVPTTSWKNTSEGGGTSREVNGVASSNSGSGTTTTTAGVNVTPLTPPMTSTFTSRTTSAAGSTSDTHYGHHHHHHQQQQQQQPRLPSIAQLERGPEMQPHYPRVSDRQYAYSNPSQHQSSGYQSQRQTYLAHQGYLQPQQHQHLPPLTPPDDIPNHIPHREQASLPQASQPSPLRPSSASAAFAHPHVEESDEEEEEAVEEDENMQAAEDSESEEEEDVFMDASRTRQRDSPLSIAHETIPPSSIYTPAPTAILRAAPSISPNYHPSYAPAAPPPLLSASPVDTYAPPPTAAAPSSSHPSYPIDWLDFTRTRSAHFIAEKTCEMICYLWFSSPPADVVGGEDDDSMLKKGAGKEEVSLTSPMKSTLSSSNPTAKRPFSSTSPPSSLQLRTTPTFVSFMQKLLETTQVSQSVIVLSLHFIYRLKERNRFTPAQKGSEFRIAVAGLMMANKFLDDNTYTNKTWSEVSGIELEEISRMEREFLLGVDFNLYVDKPTYEAWLNLLKGLVWAKERDCRRVASGVGRGRHQQQHVRGRERERAGDKPVPKKGYTTTGSTGPPSRVFTTPSAAATTATTKPSGHTGNPYPYTYRPPPRVRARSSSPTARSSVQDQTSHSTRKDYWAPDPQQQTYVYAPNNAAVGPSTTSASNSSMDLGAYTRVTQTTYPPASESRSAQASTSPAPPVFSYASSNAYAQPPSASSSAYTHQQHSQPRPSSKRTADNAFSPTSTASFALAQPSKRPVSMGGLSMNMNVSSGGSHSTGASPLDSLQSFSRMSLSMGGSPPEGTHEREREREKERERVEREREAEAERERERERHKARPPPVTLSTAYSYDSHGRSPRVPQNLYFYTLGCSPLKKDEVSSSSPASPSPSPFAQNPRYPASHPQPEGNTQTHVYPRAGQRKARLRYHQPSLSSSSSTAPYDYADLNASVRPAYPPPSTASTAKYDPQGYHIAHPQPQLPRLVMPSSTSGAIGSSTTRYLSVANAGSAASTTTSTNAHSAALPHFRDDVWAMPPAPAYTYPAPAAPASKEEAMVYENKQEEDMEEVAYTDSTTAIAPSTTEVYPSTSVTTTHNIPSAPFANAGPPGVSFSYYAEADGNDSSSPSPVTLRSTRGNTETARVGSSNNIHRVGMMDDYLGSRRASASGVSGLSGYSSRGSGYPPTASMSYAEYRAGYSTANPTSSGTARSTSQNLAHVSGHGYTSGSYSTYASPVTYHSSTSTLPVSGGYASGGGYACSSTTGNGAASGYPSGTYSAYASPHAGYGGGVER